MELKVTEALVAALRSGAIGLALAVSGCASRAEVEQATKTGQDAARVETIYGEWRDDARDRTVPYKVYLLTATHDPAPIVIFSHGLGGSREALVTS